MLNKKIISTLLLSISLITNMIGCNTPNIIGTKETPYYTLNIDGNKKYFDEDNDDVKAVQALLAEYLNLSISVDYRNDDYLKFFDLYTDASKAEDEETGYVEYFRDSTIESELIRTLNNFTISEIEFYNSYGAYTAKITYDYTCTFTSATESCLEFFGVQLNKKYSTQATIAFEKENDEWRISGFLATDIYKEIE